MTALQAQSPEIKSQSHQKKKRKTEHSAKGWKQPNVQHKGVS
jgi:hypothetical protein